MGENISSYGGGTTWHSPYDVLGPILELIPGELKLVIPVPERTPVWPLAQFFSASFL